MYTNFGWVWFKAIEFSFFDPPPPIGWVLEEYFYTKISEITFCTTLIQTKLIELIAYVLFYLHQNCSVCPRSFVSSGHKNGWRYSYENLYLVQMCCHFSLFEWNVKMQVRLTPQLKIYTDVFIAEYYIN